jgi:hypothetical protein
MGGSHLVRVAFLALDLTVGGCNSPSRSSPDQGGFAAQSVADNNRPWDAPAENESPRRWLVITGHKDSSLEIWFQTVYDTTNSKCDTYSLGTLINAAPAGSQRIYQMVRVAANETRFVVKIPLDRYRPGSCDWKATTVNVSSFLPSLTIGPGNVETFVFISAGGTRHIRLTEQCRLYRDDYRKEIFPTCDSLGMRPVEVSESGSSVDVAFTVIPIAQRNR